MPYITLEKAKEFERTQKFNSETTSSGDLNYVLTTVILQYLYVKGLQYSTINDIIGALEGTKLEFNRRVVIPYENKKIKENGDIYSDQVAPRIGE